MSAIRKDWKATKRQHVEQMRTAEKTRARERARKRREDAMAVFMPTPVASRFERAFAHDFYDYAEQVGKSLTDFEHALPMRNALFTLPVSIPLGMAIWIHLPTSYVIAVFVAVFTMLGLPKVVGDVTQHRVHTMIEDRATYHIWKEGIRAEQRELDRILGETGTQ